MALQPANASKERCGAKLFVCRVKCVGIKTAPVVEGVAQGTESTLSANVETFAAHARQHVDSRIAYHDDRARSEYIAVLGICYKRQPLAWRTVRTVVHPYAQMLFGEDSS